MRILNARQYPLSDVRFVHVATVREGLRDYVCFKESAEFFSRRRVLKPFPPHPQVYVEEIRPLTASTFSLYAIDDEELWKAIVGLLVIEGIVHETDLLEGHKDCVAVFKTRIARQIKHDEETKKIS